MQDEENLIERGLAREENRGSMRRLGPEGSSRYRIGCKAQCKQARSCSKTSNVLKPLLMWVKKIDPAMRWGEHKGRTLQHASYVVGYTYIPGRVCGRGDLQEYGTCAARKTSRNDVHACVPPYLITHTDPGISL